MHVHGQRVKAHQSIHEYFVTCTIQSFCLLHSFPHLITKNPLLSCRRWKCRPINRFFWAKEIAWWATALAFPAFQAEDMSLDPQNPRRNLRSFCAFVQSQHSVVEPGRSWEKRLPDILLWTLCACTWVLTPTYTNTHTHVHTHTLDKQ